MWVLRFVSVTSEQTLEQRKRVNAKQTWHRKRDGDESWREVSYIIYFIISARSWNRWRYSTRYSWDFSAFFSSKIWEGRKLHVSLKLGKPGVKADSLNLNVSTFLLLVREREEKIEEEGGLRFVVKGKKIFTKQTGKHHDETCTQINVNRFNVWYFGQGSICWRHECCHCQDSCYSERHSSRRRISIEPKRYPRYDYNQWRWNINLN